MTFAADAIWRSSSPRRRNTRISEPSNWSVSYKGVGGQCAEGRVQGKGGTYLADLRERRAAAPLYDSIHEFDLERGHVFVLFER